MTRWTEFLRSLRLLTAAPINNEVRTTIHADLLDRADVEAMISLLEDIGFRGTFILQNFRMGPTLGNLQAPSTRLDLTDISRKRLNIQFRNF